MFTGLVETLGIVHSIQQHANGARLDIQVSDVHWLSDVKIGDSIAINGCCLTIIKLDLAQQRFSVEAVPETLQRTNLADFRPNDTVNLERALVLGARLGGHLVQGHIDGLGTISVKQPQPDGSWMVKVSASPPLLHYLIEKGSVAVDGVSLTVVEAQHDFFTFAMIPHTAKVTTLGTKTEGQKVNLEIDLMAKYVEKLLTPWRS